MLALGTFLERRRQESWREGILLRESLLAEYMRRKGLCKRPFIKDAIEEILEDVLDVYLREDVLPLTVYAKSTYVGGRIEVITNKRIAEMPRVKDVTGIIHVAWWHEGCHVVWDLPDRVCLDQHQQPGLPGLELAPTSVTLCRGFGDKGATDMSKEFRAENAGKAAAIAGPDLERCPAFRDFRFLAANRGDLDRKGDFLLLQIAEAIGVNRTALRTYFEQRDWYRWETAGGRRRMVPNPQLAVDTLRVG